MIAYQSNNGTIAAREFTNLAAREFTDVEAQGSPAAEYWLGVLHGYGMGGLAYDPERAHALFTRALSALRPAAEQGDPVAQTILGNAHSMGRGVAVDQQQATFWFDKAIAQNHAMALHWKGKMYYDSQVEGLDEEKAIELFKQAGAAGVAASLADLAAIYKSQEQFKLSLAYLKKAAEMGFADSQYSYGHSLDEALLGLQEDNPQAIVWYQKAAAQGHNAAQNNLASMYFTGETGVPQDLNKAFELYQKSAVQGNSFAQYALGWMYLYQKNNKTIGYAWAYLSVPDEERKTNGDLKIMSKQMTTKQVARAIKLAENWRYGDIITD